MQVGESTHDQLIRTDRNQASEFCYHSPRFHKKQKLFSKPAHILLNAGAVHSGRLYIHNNESMVTLFKNIGISALPRNPIDRESNQIGVQVSAISVCALSAHDVAEVSWELREY